MPINTALVALYGITQLAQQIIEMQKQASGFTDEQLAEAWEKQRSDFKSAKQLWESLNVHK